MLVITRKLGEEIVVNGNVTVTVVEVRNGSVKIGITAPIHYPITRSGYKPKETE